MEDEDLLEDGEKEDEEEEEMGDPNSLLGGHGAQLGGGSELLCDQFHLHSPVMKKHQIVLLQVSACMYTVTHVCMYTQSVTHVCEHTFISLINVSLGLYLHTFVSLII